MTDNSNFFRLDMSKTFIATVGEEKKEFMLHTDVASCSSTFFRAAMNNHWKESKQNRITLVEIEVSEFEHYSQWLSTHDHSYLSDMTFQQLAKLYILGDFLDDSAFRVDMLLRFTLRAVTQNAYPDLDIIIAVWEQTPEHSPLRKMVVETWVTSSIERLAEQFARAEQDAPKAFVADCLRRISEMTVRVKGSVTGESLRRTLESRRDEVLKGLAA